MLELLFIAQITAIALKLTGEIAWGWIWVLSPLYLLCVGVLLVLHAEGFFSKSSQPETKFNPEDWS